MAATRLDKVRTPFSDPDGGWGGGEGASLQTDIKQVDEALNPRSKEFPEWWQKSRLTPEAQPAFDHIMSDAISQGVIKVPFGGNDMDAAQSLAIAHTVTTYALDGKGRDEMTSVFSGIGRMISRPFDRFRRRSSYDSGEMTP